MGLSITRTWPILGIETQKAKILIENNNKIDFQMKTTSPKVEINTKPLTIDIDQTAAFADEGLKGIEDLRAEMVQLARQNAYDFMAKKAQEGDRLASIENKAKAIPELARETSDDMIEFNIGIMPEHGPEFNVESAEVNIEVIPGDVQTNYNKIPLDTTFVPPEIRYYMLQEGKLDIQYIGGNVDTKI